MKYIQITFVILLITLNLLAPFACLKSRETLRIASELENQKSELTTENSSAGVKHEAKTTLNFDLKLPKTDIFYQGWMRYFHYSTTQMPHLTKPRKFYQNNRFFHQRIMKPYHKKSDTHGLFAIPNKAAYYVILYKDSLAIFDSRNDIMSSQVDNLSIKSMTDIPENDILQGAVKNLGDFPTGSCVDIETGHGKLSYWIICFDTNKEKGIFTKTLIKLRVHYQRLRNPIPVRKGGMRQNQTMGASLKSGGHESSTILDGYWILLQDWTSCSLKCGGGQKYQQWMCSPPKNGGKPCKGKPIRTKACNIQPCPSPKVLLAQHKASKGKDKGVRKPLMQVGRFSARPQKYSKCLLKENDAFLTDIDKKGQITKKVPIRILMNNQTISIFNNDDFSSHLLNFKLEETNFLPKQYCCFTLRDKEKSKHICGYPENCGLDIKANKWATDWQRDHHLFKVLCKTGREAKMITEDDLKGINEDDVGLNEGGIDVDIVVKRKRQLLKEMHAEETKAFKQNIAQTQEVGYRAIEREINIENLVKKEEQAKEEAEIHLLEKKVKSEEKKAECVHKSIEEKDFDDSYDDKIEALDEMERLKAQINNKVSDSRNRIKKLLGKMRTTAARRKAVLDQKLKAVRAHMAKDILLANREGDIRKCIRAKKDLDFRTSYCNQNFVDDYVMNSACKSNEDGCYTCCENEFGSNNRGKRNFCYKMCDDNGKKANKKKAAAKKAAKDNHSWLWAPQTEVHSH